MPRPLWLPVGKNSLRVAGQNCRAVFPIACSNVFGVYVTLTDRKSASLIHTVVAADSRERTLAKALLVELQAIYFVCVQLIGLEVIFKSCSAGSVELPSGSAAMIYCDPIVTFDSNNELFFRMIVGDHIGTC